MHQPGSAAEAGLTSGDHAGAITATSVRWQTDVKPCCLEALSAGPIAPATCDALCSDLSSLLSTLRTALDTRTQACGATAASSLEAARRLMDMCESGLGGDTPLAASQPASTQSASTQPARPAYASGQLLHAEVQSFLGLVQCSGGDLQGLSKMEAAFAACFEAGAEPAGGGVGVPGDASWHLPGGALPLALAIATQVRGWRGM